MYEGKSQAGYTSEPFWGQVKIAIKNGRISALDFKIMDVLKNQIFDQYYEKNYAGNDMYVQQCRENWKWLQKYPLMPVETQSLDRVDSVSGATWARNLFISTVKKALAPAEQAK